MALATLLAAVLTTIATVPKPTCHHNSPSPGANNLGTFPVTKGRTDQQKSQRSRAPAGCGVYILGEL